MTGTELYNRLIEFGDIDVSDSIVKGWIDQAQADITTEFPVMVSHTITDVVAGTTTYEVTTGIIDIISAVYVTLDVSGEYPLSSISISGNTMTFLLAADSLTVTYLTMAAPYTNMADQLTVHPMFHTHILNYLISMYYDSEAEGDPEESSIAREFYQRWLYYKNQVTQALSSTNIYTQGDPVKTINTLPTTRRRPIVEDDYFE